MSQPPRSSRLGIEAVCQDLSPGGAERGSNSRTIQEFELIDALVNNANGFEFKPMGKNIGDRRGRIDEIREL